MRHSRCQWNFSQIRPFFAKGFRRPAIVPSAAFASIAPGSVLPADPKPGSIIHVEPGFQPLGIGLPGRAQGGEHIEKGKKRIGYIYILYTKLRKTLVID